MSRRKTPIRQVWHRPTYRVSRKQIPEEWTNHRFVHDSLLLCATANIPSPIMLILFIHLFFSSNIFTILLNYEKKLSSPKGKEISTKRLRRFFSFFSFLVAWSDRVRFEWARYTSHKRVYDVNPVRENFSHRSWIIGKSTHAIEISLRW